MLDVLARSLTLAHPALDVLPKLLPSVEGRLTSFPRSRGSTSPSIRPRVRRFAACSARSTAAEAATP